MEIDAVSFVETWQQSESVLDVERAMNWPTKKVRELEGLLRRHGVDLRKLPKYPPVNESCQFRLSPKYLGVSTAKYIMNEDGSIQQGGVGLYGG